MAVSGKDDEDVAQQQAQKVVFFTDVNFDSIRVKPKTRNPDRQKQCFPIKYIDSKIKGGRNLQELSVSFCLGHPDQKEVNTVISQAKAYQRDLSMPPENPQNLSIGIKFTDPEVVEWITHLNESLLRQLEETGVTAADPVRPDIPVDELKQLFKPPFTPTDDGGYVGYFSFTDDSLRTKPMAGRMSKMPVFEVQPYGYDTEESKIVLYSEERRQIHYSEIKAQEDYCMVIFTLGAMRLDSMTSGNRGSRYPYIGSKLYLEKMVVLQTKEEDTPAAVNYDDMASLMGSRIAVRVVRGEGEEGEHHSKRVRAE